jgi:type VI secretion system protein ImpE
MSAEELIQEGRPDEALTTLQQEVRAHPADSRLRVFLFQLLCIQGQWKRALNQLDVLREMDASTLPMVQTYREAIRCELLRAEVFAGRRAPMIFGDPAEWIALLIEALRLDGAREHAHADHVRGQALEAAPATSGRIADQPFEWLADADLRLGPVLEAVINGRYFWVPVHRVAELHLDPPADLRDLVWAPGYFTWPNGGQVAALIPTRYPGSESAADPRIRLARLTDWHTGGGELSVGLGQRLLATDADEYPLLNLRQVTLDTGETPPGEGETGEAPAASAPDG